jgi:hypothetical protein
VVRDGILGEVEFGFPTIRSQAEDDEKKERLTTSVGSAKDRDINVAGPDALFKRTAQHKRAIDFKKMNPPLPLSFITRWSDPHDSLLVAGCALSRCSSAIMPFARQVSF